METKKFWFITSNQQSKKTVAQEAILTFLAQAENVIIEDAWPDYEKPKVK